MNNILKIGIDIGSTTVKLVVLDVDNKVLHADYRRHNMNVRETVQTVLQPVAERFAENQIKVAVTGSVRMGYADLWGFPFVQ